MKSPERAEAKNQHPQPGSKSRVIEIQNNRRKTILIKNRAKYAGICTGEALGGATEEGANSDAGKQRTAGT